jgi:L-cysteine:1D-myo-inositol 2-amino-2-deoxy-alpha-D-glucopyranoside ligase
MRSWSAPELPRLPGTGPPVRVHDSATRSTRLLAPSGEARIYVCGITPYDAAHLGHAFTYLTYDLLHRALLDAGQRVAYVQNVTDVDDPLFERADRDGEDWRELGTREIERFRTDMAALRVLPPRAYVGAVEAIPLIIDMIEELRDRGASYSLEGDLYFPVSIDARFGYLARLGPTEMRHRLADNGGDPDRAGKKDPLDVLLWRAWRPGEPSWPSPFGDGRPGWHIECSAIARAHLGDTIDVQGGGTDLIYPHHEYSAAHAEVATGAAPFADTYVHTAVVALDGHKMSKSRGNLVFVSALRRRAAPAAIRLALLAHHHTREWEWTDEELTAAVARLDRWRAATMMASGPDARELLAEVRERLSDGLDAPGALAAVDRWVDACLAVGGDDREAPALARDIVDALLGVDLDPVPPVES